jgi:hypothetical protein
MTGDSHIRNLGKLNGNLHSLEIILRIFLQKQDSTRATRLPYGHDIYDLAVGTELDESVWTNFNTLRTLIDRFNEYAVLNGVASIDKTIVDLRDALAHGRVSALTETFPLRLIKFDKPINKKVRVAFNEELTEHWFQNNINRVYAAISIVNSCMNAE